MTVIRTGAGMPRCGCGATMTDEKKKKKYYGKKETKAKKPKK